VPADLDRFFFSHLDTPTEAFFTIASLCLAVKPAAARQETPPLSNFAEDFFSNWINY
jgi:hypothetical protein